MNDITKEQFKSDYYFTYYSMNVGLKQDFVMPFII